MELNDRIKLIRNNEGITQQEFADKLGLKRNTVASYEINKITPSDRTILDICREFNVNENWLRTGEGEMFRQQNTDEEIAAFIGDVLSGDNDFKRRFILFLARLSENEWQLLETMLKKLAEGKKKDGGN